MIPASRACVVRGQCVHLHVSARPGQCFASPLRSMAQAATGVDAIVSPAWLSERLNNRDIRILDATWYSPAMHPGKDVIGEFKQERIPHSARFDLDAVADTTTTDIPHMLPSERVFAAALDALHITPDTHVVAYDRFPTIYSAPRLWWTFKVFGHEKVSVLEGGFPAWKAQALPLETDSKSDDEIFVASKAAANPPEHTKYPAHLDISKVRNKQQMLDNLEKAAETVMDARAAGRFNGVDPEPRPGLRKGRIPGSTNVPFQSVQQGGGLKPASELREIFLAAGAEFEKPLVASCGSGMTACIIALAAYQASGGQKLVPVYDGSFMEWGSPSAGTPVEPAEAGSKV